MAGNTRSISEPDTPAFEQADTPRGALHEIGQLTGQPFPLPYASVEALKERGFTSEELYAIVAPRRTLARRKEAGENLTVAESDRVLRIRHIADMADRIFADPEKAHRWLRKRSRVLKEVPVVLLQSETGARLVAEELNRIEYGMFS